MDKEVQDTVLLGELLEPSDILFFEMDDLCRGRVTGKPLCSGLAHHLVVLVGDGDQEGGYVFQANSGQFDSTLCDLHCFFHNQVGGFTAHICHYSMSPFKYALL